jgi:hypothetical protein
MARAPGGTPAFMALSALRGQRQSVSSELESAFYVFLFWATRGGLRWARAPRHAPDAVDRKWAGMTLRFHDKVLGRIPEHELRQAAVRLRELFFPGGFGYNMAVSSTQFVQALDGAS